MITLGIRLLKVKRIRFRITIYFSLIIFLIISAISFSISYIFSNEIITQTSSVVQQKMGLITRDIDEKLTAIRNLYYNIRSNDLIEKTITSKYISEDEEANKAKAISGILSSFSSGDNTIASIIAVDLSNRVLDPVFSNYLFSKSILENEDYKDFLKKNYFSKFSAPSTFPIIASNPEEKDKQTITYFGQLLKKSDYSKIGYVLINIKKESLFSDIKPYSSEVFDACYIINKDGKLIYQIGNIAFPQNILTPSGPETYDFQNTTEIKGKKYLVFNQKIKSYSDWSVVGLLSNDRLTKNVLSMNLIIYAIGLFCIFLVIFIGFYISKRITEPILEVNNAMSKFEKGEWPEEINTKAEDELKYLVKGFNGMVKNIKNLIDEIYKEQEDKKKAEVNALQFQLESLQSQINPHFMYNTLNAISYLALRKGAEDIREMIQSFNILLRASMSTSKEFITISEEIDCILSYLKIQECRYDNIFEFTYKVPEDMKHYKIPRLILQPIVENSLFHGIAPKNSHGNIKVEFISENDRIKVSVIDDGVGIRKSAIPEIIKKGNSRNKSSFNNIGLVNVDERLKLYFGEEYRLKVYSSIGIGTCIEFYIPFMD